VRPGDALVLRYFKYGGLCGALPLSVLDDWAFALAPGARVRWAAVGGRNVREVPARERFSSSDWGSVDMTWDGEGVVIVGRPGRAHSIWHFWEGADFAGWYVNLEAPWQPSAVGFDTEDHDLDLWIEPDGSWRWKDEDELEIAVEAGLYTLEQAAAFRGEGERVLEEWPFPTGWEKARPDASRSPKLPESWDVV
jgi:hypothetical protein